MAGGTIYVWLDGMKPRLPRSGFALMVALLLTCVLLVAVVAMLGTSSRGLFSAGQYQRRVIAQQAAEAGLARAMSTLEQDLDFTGTLVEALPHAGAEFRLDIVSAGTVGPLQSVNNLTSDSPKSSPMGDIPARAALLVSRGTAAGTEVVLRALVQEADETMGLAMLASHRVQLHDDVMIRGLESFSTNVPMPAGLHSNYTGTGPAISWQASNPTHRLKASGDLSVSSAEIDLDPPTQVEVAAVRTEQPQYQHLNIDIQEMVSLHSSSPAPPPFPTVGSLTLPAGTYYLAGDRTLNGDLILSDGAQLYLDGDLTVNGSITGVGTVAVTGFTSLKGDSHVSVPDGDYLAVLSRQGVSLTGFDGTAYLQGLADSDSVVGAQWPRLRDSLQGLQAVVALPPSHWAGEAGLTDNPGASSSFDTHRNAVGNASGAANLISQRLPSGATADFLRSKFYQMRLTYHMAWHTIEDNVAFTGGPVARRAYINSILDAWLDGIEQPNQGSPADALTSQSLHFSGLTPQEQAGVHRIKAQIELEDLDKPGAAYFKGLVYTNGPLYVGHELTVVGALEAQGLADVPARTIDGVTLEAGDVYLAPKSDLVYVRELLRSELPLGRSGTLKVVFSYVD